MRYLCNFILDIVYLFIVYLMSVCFNMNLFLHNRSLRCVNAPSVGPGEIQKLLLSCVSEQVMT